MMEAVRNGAWAKAGQKTYDVQDYVGWDENTLISMFDGIRNVGATAEHSLSSNVWNDLKNSSRILTLRGAHFDTDCLVEDTKTYNGCECSNISPGLKSTIEILLYCPHSLTGNAMFYLLRDNRYYLGVWRFFNLMRISSEAVWGGSGASSFYHDGTLGLMHIVLTTDCADEATTTEVGAWLNGVEVDAFVGGVGSSGTSNPQTTKLFWSHWGTSDASPIGSKIFAMRVHSRILTASEIAANYAIDKARFGLP